jgi:nucleoside-diphosphate-sugar epimerase
MTDLKDTLVLVTGGSGFLGAHCIIALLRAGYRVRTTVRSLKRESDVQTMLKNGDAPRVDSVTFVEADLSKDDGWSAAVEGCTYVLHVASPFPTGPPKHEDDLIIPAREGVLRVLRASKAAGVRRVVLTSSFAAIGYGHGSYEGKVLTEEDWTPLDGPDLAAYPKSKTIAERAAWDWVKKEGGPMELVVINPTAIFGPVLSGDFAPSILIIQRMMKGDIPGLPHLSMGVVDVRDVAELELLAMTNSKANGERFLAAAPGVMTMQDMSMTLHERMPEAAKKAPTRTVPNIVLKIMAFFDKNVALITHDLGKRKEFSVEKAENLLGWKARSNKDAVIATAESLIKYKMV